MPVDRHSKVVAWLKVILPISALVLLSTLFLLSRSIDPTASIPFADAEIQQRLQNQQLSGPFFSGSTADGDKISFSAAKMTAPSGQVGQNEATQIEAQIETLGGQVVQLNADLARVDLAKDVTDLSGAVRFVTNSGHRLDTERLVAKMSKVDLRAPGDVEGSALFGRLTAGQMRYFSPVAGEPAQLFFTDGVKLVYDPEKSEE